MPDDFGRLVAAIEGEDPSPDFVSSLRAELEAELADQGSDDLPDDIVVVDLDPKDATPQTGRQTMERKWLVVGGAAAAVILLIAVVAGIALASGGEDDNEVAVAVGADGTELTDQYFEAFAAGDVETAVGFLLPGATIEQTWIDEPGDSTGVPTESTAKGFLAVQTWLVAQGTEFSSPTCVVTDEGADSTTVSCEWEVYDGIAQAIDAGPLPVVSTIVVTEDGISALYRDHGPPAYTRVWDPFEEWMDESHPEVDWFFDEESIEVSRQNGTTAAEYAAEWAALLEANGCDYEDEPCTTEVGIGRAFVEALDSWDGEAAGALLADGAVVEFLAATPEEMLTLADWYRVTGSRTDVSVCRQLGDPSTVICSYTFENAWSEALGVGPYTRGNTFLFTIEDGQITELTNTITTNKFSPEVWEVFLAWVEDNHPEAVPIMFDRTGPEEVPIMTAEAIALWEQYTEEFVASVTE